MIKIVTHSGSFHADDVFAVATLQIHLGVGNVEIVRTRDEDIISSSDWVVDVGGEYNPEARRFDHHQNGAPVRENGIAYAAFGLVWKEIGPILTGSEEGAKRIEEYLVQAIDSGDVGHSLYELKDPAVSPVEVYQIVNSYAPAWDDEGSKDDAFLLAVEWARGFLERLIQKQQSQLKMEEYVAQVYNSSVDKSILVFEKNVPSLALVKYEEVLMVVTPSSSKEDNNWSASAVRKSYDAFDNRVSFPESWAGLRGEELVGASGISDAVFCHKARFLFVTSSKEGALIAAKKAVTGLVV